jgi:hypothetical protein
MQKISRADRKIDLPKGRVTGARKQISEAAWKDTL